MIIELSQSLQRTRPHLAKWIEEAATWAARFDEDIDLSGIHVTVRRSAQPRQWSGKVWPHSASLDRRRHKRRKHPSGRATLTIGYRVPRSEVIRIALHELRHIGQFARGKREFGYLCCTMADGECEIDSRLFEGRVMAEMGVSDTNWWRDLGLLYKPQGRIVHVKGISDFVNVRVSDKIPKGIVIIESGEVHA